MYTGTTNFVANNNDPEAAIITAYDYFLGPGGEYIVFTEGQYVDFGMQIGVTELIFYDGPTPHQGVFDEFSAISPFTQDVSIRSFSWFVRSSPSNTTYRTR